MPPKVEAAPPETEPVQAADEAPVVEAQPAPEAEPKSEQVEVPAAPAEPTSPTVYTAEQVEELKREAHAEGRAKGQSDADGRFQAWLKKRDADERDGAIYDRYHAMRHSQDPEERDIFLNEVYNKPDVRKAFERGEEVRKQPPAEALEQFKIPWMTELIGPFLGELQAQPELKNEPRDEVGNIKLDSRPESLTQHAVMLYKLAIQKGAEALAAKQVEKAVEGAKKAERARVLAEVGVEPEQIEGGGGDGPLTPARYKVMSNEERAKLPPDQIDAMTRKYLS